MAKNKQTKKTTKKDIVKIKAKSVKKSNTWKFRKKKVIRFIEDTKTEQEFHNAIGIIS